MSIKFHITTLDYEIAYPWKRNFEKQSEDIEYDSDGEIIDKPKSRNNRLPHASAVPIIKMFGLTEDNKSVLAHVTHFLPYFYVPAWIGITKAACYQFGQQLNAHLGEGKLYKLEVVHASSVYGYHFGVESRFLKITLTNPRHVPEARNWCETNRRLMTFESNLPFDLRFCIDNSVGGCVWATVDKGQYKHVPQNKRQSDCDYEIQLHHSALQPLSSKEKSDIPRMKILSTDIECGTAKGKSFPVPEKDPVIQISSVVAHYQAKSTILSRHVHVLGACDAFTEADTVREQTEASSSIPSCSIPIQIHSFTTESEMLLHWSKFLCHQDPDIVTGYNINKFDFPYLLNRAKRLGIYDEFSRLSRIKNHQVDVFESNQQERGKPSNKPISIPGRIVFDVFTEIKKEAQLRTYGLNAVAQHYLNAKKDQIDHSQIKTLQLTGAKSRKVLAKYCEWDAHLPLRLIDHLSLIVNVICMSRVTGVPVSQLLNRGQTVKVVSQLASHSLAKKILMPCFGHYSQEKKKFQSFEDGDDLLSTSSDDENGEEEDNRNTRKRKAKYQGATVIEPTAGFYCAPVITLDFSSLYPSIMMAHNLCYSTWISPNLEFLLRESESDKQFPTHVTPFGARFLDEKKLSGLLPSILDNLLKERKIAKNQLKDATDPIMCAILEGKQLALKRSANSVYGFTGAEIGPLPCVAIGASVTSYGRDMIQMTKKIVETELFNVPNKNRCATVIYGDTDSVMIRVTERPAAEEKSDKIFTPEEVLKIKECISLEESMQIGEAVADAINVRLPKPMKLEFEKSFYPFFLLAKKRYAGIKWVVGKDGKPKRVVMDMKGIEAVRRDNCRLVSEAVKQVLNLLLRPKPAIEETKEYVRNLVSDLAENRVDFSKLVISKSLNRCPKGDATFPDRSNGEYATLTAHAEVARKRRLRGETDIGLRDRIPFITTSSHAPGAKHAEMAEDPVYAVQHEMTPDVNYYLKQLETSLTRLLAPVINEKETASLFEIFKLKLAPSTNKRGIGKFAVKRRKCLGCKSIVPVDVSGSICPMCDVEKVKQDKLEEWNLVSKQVEDLKETCRKCQESLGTEGITIECAHWACDIFFSRFHRQNDLKHALQNLSDLGITPPKS